RRRRARAQRGGGAGVGGPAPGRPRGRHGLGAARAAGTQRERAHRRPAGLGRPADGDDRAVRPGGDARGRGVGRPGRRRVTRVELYRIAVPDADLAELHARLAATRWADELPDGGWGDGADPGTMRALVTRWREGFDWRAEEAD